MRLRFEQQLRIWLKSRAGGMTGAGILEGFQFGSTALGERLKAKLAVSWESDHVLIAIPGMDTRQISAPAGTEGIQLQMAVAGSALASAMPGGSAAIIHNFPAGETLPAAVRIPLELKAGMLYILAASLKYKIDRRTGSEFVDDEKWTAAEIIGAWVQAAATPSA